MKKENVFETDSPTIEMETQTIRRSQNGHTAPLFNGNANNPYSAFNGTTNTPFQQNGYSQFNGLTTPQSYMQPNNYQQQGYAPFNTPINPAYYNTLPTPAWMYQQQYGYPTYQPTPTNFYPTPYNQPISGPWAVTPMIPTNYGSFNTLQPITSFQTNPYQQISNYQPVINPIDGRYTMVPTQYNPSTSRNNWSHARNSDSDFTSWTPTVNILETDRTFKIEMCVPGVSRENIHIHIDRNNVLRVTGTRRWNQESEAVGFTRKDFNYGSFECSFIIAENWQREKITSSCRNGILIISIPKRDRIDSDDRTSSEISVN